MNQMPDNTTKRQHVVPQFYLRGFADAKGKLHVYDRKERRYFAASPKDLLCENMFYETKWEGASPVLGEYVLFNELEHRLSESESRYCRLMNRIVENCGRIKRPDTPVCNDDELELLAEFISSLFLRNPKTFQDVEAEYADCSEMDICKSVEALFSDADLGSANSLIKHAVKQGILNASIPGSPAFVEKQNLLKMRPLFIQTKTIEFITSSNPVVTLGVISGNTDSGKMIQVEFFPLSPKMVVMYTNDPTQQARTNRLLFAEDELSIWVNRLHLEMSIEQARFIIANNQEQLLSFVNSNTAASSNVE